MDSQISELRILLHSLEEKIKNQEEDIDSLDKTMQDLRAIVTSLDKETAVKDEKLINVIRQVNLLDSQFEKLKDEVGAVSASKSNFMEKIVLTLIGSAIGALFSYVSSK